MASLLRRRLFNKIVGRTRHGGRGWNWYYKALEKEKEVPLGPHVLHYKPLKPDHVRPRAFLDLAGEDNNSIGRIVIELADDIVPKTVENFTKLCTGEAESGYTYKGNKILQIIPNHVIQTGDVTNSKTGRDGHGATERCGVVSTVIVLLTLCCCVVSHRCFWFFCRCRYFDDENFILGHPERGIVSMNNSGVNRNNSQFFITLGPAPHLDGRRVSFGRVVEGLELLDTLEGMFTLDFKPVDEVVIADSGVLS